MASKLRNFNKFEVETDDKNKLKKGNKFIHRVWYYLKLVLIIFFGSSILVTLIYRFVPPPVTPLMLIRVAGQLVDGKPVKMTKDWMPLDKISKNLEQAVVASEDNEFLEHYGFDFEAIKKASELNKKGKKIRGASTISQQTAKNVFLWPQRSWVRKGLEVYFTGLIEIFWGKRRIMEVYLNVIEMGDGIYGAEAAARSYFNKPAIKLTKAESALIAAVLPNPRKWSPAQPTSYIQRKQKWILWNMGNIEKIDFGK